MVFKIYVCIFYQKIEWFMNIVLNNNRIIIISREMVFGIVLFSNKKRNFYKHGFQINNQQYIFYITL